MDKTRKTIGIIDYAESVIWTQRFNSPGDFEIYVRASINTLSLLQTGNYVYRLDNSMVGIIQKIVLTEDIENGDYLTVTGVDIMGILSRRIVWNQTILSGNAETAIYKLIKENIINPTKTTRTISGITVPTSTTYTETIRKQATGTNLMECITDMCDSLGYGCQMIMDVNHNFNFSVYKGSNRSISQITNPQVIFSYEFDNLSSTEYEWDENNFKNVALVAGEGEGSARKTTAVGNSSGLDRYEVYVDARDLSTNDGEISNDDYIAQLQQRGNEQLSQMLITENYSGEIIPGQTYIYDEDYKLGDIVTVQNKYGITANVRIVEVIHSEDTTGTKIIPTFDNWEVS